VATRFDYLTMFHDVDHIGAVRDCEAVGNDDRGTIASEATKSVEPL
jgi:hypothetical protein